MSTDTENDTENDTDRATAPVDGDRDPTPDGGVLAALDIGTNSFHMVVARIAADDGFEIVTKEKEVVRLGAGGTDMKRLSPDAIERALDCIKRMRVIADSHGAVELRAVATSATREADNAAELIERARDEAGVDIEVISGLEEARLIHLGVLRAVPVFDRRVLLVDVGGGSTEVLIGERADVLAARSFKLGAVRLTDRFFPGGEVDGDAVEACRGFVRSILTHFERDAERHGFDVAVASSGTAEAVARMVQAARGGKDLTTYNCFEIGADELHEVTEALCGVRTATARAKLPGLEPGRADIAPAGALILDEVVAAFGIDELVFSEAALRDGVLVDTAERSRGWSAGGDGHLRDVTRRSVRQLMHRCDDDPAHSAQVARLACAVFDGLADLHGLGPAHREILEVAALLANVGLVVSHSRHHHHSYYVIRHSELTGLTDHEIEIIAQVARYHRKSAPKPSHAPFAALDDDDQALVRTLAAILRVAIGLDRCHERRVASLRLDVSDDRVMIFVRPDQADISIELFSANERKGLLEQVTGRRVELMPTAG